jgi:hypothetical protein
MLLWKLSRFHFYEFWYIELPSYHYSFSYNVPHFADDIYICILLAPDAKLLDLFKKTALFSFTSVSKLLSWCFGISVLKTSYCTLARTLCRLSSQICDPPIKQYPFSFSSLLNLKEIGYFE